MVAETSDDAVVYKYVRGAGLLYTENATDEKTWYVKDAHGDTVQLTDSNKTVLSNKQMQTGFGELRDELHQIVRIA